MHSSLSPVLRHVLFAASLAAAPLTSVQAADCAGIVYEDANGNGRRDASRHYSRHERSSVAGPD